MNTKLLYILAAFSLSTKCLQAFSVYLYNNSGEPLSISYSQKADARFTTQTLDYKVKKNTLSVELTERISINKANNQSITISSNQNEEKDANFKSFIVSGHNLNGANYSYSVQCKASITKPYLIIDSDDSNYEYKISTKSYGANT